MSLREEVQVDAMPVSLAQNFIREKFVPDTAVLLIGHGTRKSSGQDEFRSFYQSFSKCIAPLPSAFAFLELANPTIQESIAQIVQDRSARRLLVVPMLLFAAGHALDDIPAAVRQALSGTGIEYLGQTEPLECNIDVLQLSALRFRQSLCGEACQGVCCGKFCNDTSWILVGRGSTNHSAAEKMREFCSLRQELTPVRQATPAFIFGQSPTVSEAFQIAASSDAQHVVVQPHLLFSGLLFDELTEQVEQASRQNQQQKWIITQPLGGDTRLAELVARKALMRLSQQPGIA